MLNDSQDWIIWAEASWNKEYLFLPTAPDQTREDEARRDKHENHKAVWSSGVCDYADNHQHE